MPNFRFLMYIAHTTRRFLKFMYLPSFTSPSAAAFYCVCVRTYVKYYILFELSFSLAVAASMHSCAIWTFTNSVLWCLLCLCRCFDNLYFKSYILFCILYISCTANGTHYVVCHHHHHHHHHRCTNVHSLVMTLNDY